MHARRHVALASGWGDVRMGGLPAHSVSATTIAVARFACHHILRARLIRVAVHCTRRDAACRCRNALQASALVIWDCT